MDVMGSNDLASTALYHRLLNCGFRLTASAGTDCFLNRIRSFLPGAERVYVKTKGPLTYESWIEGLKAGRSFVTNGPVLDLSVNGTEIGGQVELAAAAKVRIKATASPQYPLDRVEVLYNGKMVATAKPGNGLTAAIEVQISVDRSGWIALRASGPPQADVEGELVYAHTSPVCVTVGGQPAGSAEDAKYFLAWIDRRWAVVEDRDRIPGKERKAGVQGQIDRAREVYRRIIARGGGE